MAVHGPTQQPAPTIDPADSDYGSDLDNDAWDAIFSQPPESQPTIIPQLKIEESVVEEPILPDDAEPQTHSLRLARIRENLEAAIRDLDGVAGELEQKREQHKVEIEYEREEEFFAAVEVEEVKATSVEPESVIDTRSPLERFRTKPKKPLSVTDLVSPAWCELQYWYSLTKYGRVRRTPAMKQGSKIHKEKEMEVHTEVPVEIATKEDRLGLRLWNIIQGLRTLRTTGLTRELEVLGVVEGEVVVGIIDEVSYYCPDYEMEQSILEAAETARNGGKKQQASLPPDQRTMNDFFPGGGSTSQNLWLGTLHQPPKTLYLVDIKTRNSKTLPKSGSQMRPTQMQLMLYRRLLHALAANEVDAEKIFERYDLEPQKPFSDVFIAGMGSIDFSASQHSDEPMASDPDPVEEILSYNTLSSLWAHMIAEFARTISVTPLSSSISPLLTAEFRAASDGAVIGRRSFAFEEGVIKGYVKDEMRWWRGERETKGVDVEEAFKCGICEFSEGCEWRVGKVEEARVRARERGMGMRRGRGKI
ncbi:hypothetical protein M409DRAFT_16241 [Zasmidium cellare ATCC 36951]|uniref:Exonuclease V n=1 Tax=Zasmidium cellare ATCC 36951 TaxID=1080233 RepID=A0A6A6D3I2_ZASCE|nr:uncharacterized protein M409DRAFT_16241 [Zasmidium cellare ATCC 36951]KAF2173971.1 hypothetical protein M409DRAFT_16241 [Zasmidium cellare ATCC 36951]